MVRGNSRKFCPLKNNFFFVPHHAGSGILVSWLGFEPMPPALDGEGNGTPLQYSCLENSKDGEVHGITKSRTQLSDFTLTFHFRTLEKEMATHSSVLGWRIPGTGEPGGLPSMGLHRVGHDWGDLAAAAAGYCIFLVAVVNEFFPPTLPATFLGKPMVSTCYC